MCRVVFVTVDSNTCICELVSSETQTHAHTITHTFNVCYSCHSQLPNTINILSSYSLYTLKLTLYCFARKSIEIICLHCMFCVVPIFKKFKVNFRKYHNLSRPQTNTGQSSQFSIKTIKRQITVNTS